MAKVAINVLTRSAHCPINVTYSKKGIPGHFLLESLKKGFSIQFCWNGKKTPCASLLLQITCQASCSRHQPCTFCCVCVGGPSQWTNFIIARYRQSCGFSTTRGEPRVWWTWTDMATPSGLVECFYRQTTVNQACIHETPVYWGGSLSFDPLRKVG